MHSTPLRRLDKLTLRPVGLRDLNFDKKLRLTQWAILWNDFESIRNATRIDHPIARWTTTAQTNFWNVLTPSLMAHDMLKHDAESTSQGSRKAPTGSGSRIFHTGKKSLCPGMTVVLYTPVFSDVRTPLDTSSFHESHSSGSFTESCQTRYFSSPSRPGSVTTGLQNSHQSVVQLPEILLYDWAESDRVKLSFRHVRSSGLPVRLKHNCFDIFTFCNAQSTGRLTSPLLSRYRFLSLPLTRNTITAVS